MFQRFASALFGDDVEELSRPGGGKEEEEEDEDWILVNYLAEACSGSGSTVSPAEEEVEEEEEEEDEDLVVIPSPVAGPRVRYASCTSLNSTADTDLDGGAEEEEDEEEASGFLRLDAGSLEESWFVTPPPCFTGHSIKPLPLEPNPLENLLIEHPSMSVYAYHDPPRISHEPLPQTLDLELSLLSSSVSLTPTPTASGAKKKCRCGQEGPRHRPEVAVVQCRNSLHNACCVAAAALSARSNLLQQRAGNVTQRVKPLSRNALRRLNLRRPSKASTLNLHQPSQRHLNF